MLSFLQSSWMAALVGGVLYLGTTAALLSPAHFAGAARSAEVPVARSANDDPSWRFRNPELEQVAEELQREKDALAVRRQELEEWAGRLNAERLELFGATQLVHQLQLDFDKNVVRFQAQEAENLKREVKVMTAMSPAGAAGVLNEMPDAAVVKLLSLMKVDEAGAILEAIGQSPAGAKRAADLTELLRRVLPAEARPKSGRTP